jgi:predicted dehydrogenase
MQKLRIGIIGAGGIATARHIPAFKQLNEVVDVTAVCDVNVEKAKQVQKQFEIPNIYENYVEMLPQVDAVVICTPNKFHAEMSIAALNAGVHVLCEKPMAMNTRECEEMIKAKETSGKTLWIAYHYRWMKEAQAAKKVIEQGEIGKPLVVRVKALRRRKVPGWGVFTNKDLQGGGCIIDYGCHLLDLSLWLMGNPEVKEVTGSTYNLLSKTPNQVNEWGSFNHQTFNVEDHASAYIRFQNGTSLLFETSWSANITTDEETLSISGEKGGLDVFPFSLNYAKHGMLFNSHATYIPEEEDEGVLQAKAFVETCLGMKAPLVKPEEAMQVSKIIDAIYESSLKSESIPFSKLEGCSI